MIGHKDRDFAADRAQGPLGVTAESGKQKSSINGMESGMSGQQQNETLDLSHSHVG